jgi:hypothetical protein
MSNCLQPSVSIPGSAMTLGRIDSTAMRVWTPAASV